VTKIPFDEGLANPLRRHLGIFVAFRDPQTVHLGSKTNKLSGRHTCTLVFKFADNLLVVFREQPTLVIGVIGCVEKIHVVFNVRIKIFSFDQIAEAICVCEAQGGVVLVSVFDVAIMKVIH